MKICVVVETLEDSCRNWPRPRTLSDGRFEEGAHGRSFLSIWHLDRDEVRVLSDHIIDLLAKDERVRHFLDRAHEIEREVLEG